MIKSFENFVRLEKACEMYGCGRKKVRKMAADADALYKVEKVLLIDAQKLEKYIREYFQVTE